MAIVGRAKYTGACEISRRSDARGAPKIRDYRLSQGYWAFTAEWFWGVNFLSSFKRHQLDSFSWFLSFALVIDKLGRMLSHMKHCASFILIPPGLDGMGRDLSRGKTLEEETNISFGIWDVSNISVPGSGPVRYQKPVKHFYGLSSRRGHFLPLQNSHQKK